MRIAAMLRAIRLLPASPPGNVDDQTYSEAVMEHAVRESDKSIERLTEVAERGVQSNQRLNAGIERLKISNVDQQDVMADLVRGKKSRDGRPCAAGSSGPGASASPGAPFRAG
jgi:hypothetical protein